jgi:hypothetical protein
MLKVAKFPSVAWAAAGEVPLNMQTVLPDDTEGNYAVIRSILIKAVITVTTGAGVSSYGANVAKALKTLIVRDGQGDLIRLTGPQLRMMDIFERGIRAYPDVADIAQNGNGEARTVWLRFDCQPRMAKRGQDYGIYVSSLKYVPNAGIILDMPAASDLGFTGGTPTLTSIVYTVHILYDRVEELCLNTRREVKAVQMSEAANLYLQANGKSIRAAILHKAADAAHGGTALNSCTAVNSEAFGWSNVPPEVFQKYLLDESEQRHDPASTTDPFVPAAFAALALVHPSHDEELLTMPVHDGQPLIELTSQSVTAVQCILDAVTDRTEDSTAGVVAQTHGKAFDMEVKSAGGSKRSLADWKSPRLTKRLPVRLRLRK